MRSSAPASRFSTIQEGTLSVQSAFFFCEQRAPVDGGRSQPRVSSLPSVDDPDLANRLRLFRGPGFGRLITVSYPHEDLCRRLWRARLVLRRQTLPDWSGGALPVAD